VIGLYREWSAPKARGNRLIPLFYCTAYGNTRRIAEAVREGIQAVLPEADVECYNVGEHDMAKLAALLNESDAFLLGPLTINREAVPPIWQLVSSIDAVNIPKRPVALFGSFGWSGEGFAHISGQLTALKANLFGEQFKVSFVPSDSDLEAARQFGGRFAQSLAQ
jgi:flavorubredoxin